MEQLASSKRSSSSTGRSAGSNTTNNNNNTSSNATNMNSSGTSYTTIVGGGTVKDTNDFNTMSSGGSKAFLLRRMVNNTNSLPVDGKQGGNNSNNIISMWTTGKSGEPCDDELAGESCGASGKNDDNNTNNNVRGSGEDSSLYDPRYFTMTMPNLPPHRYTIANIGSRMPHMTYNVADIETIVTTHRQPLTCGDKFAVNLVSFVGFIMNGITRFDTSVVGSMPKDKWVSRAVFLESVAAVPGMIAAMVRHLDSLRRMKRDHGWVRHLLEEADNERMHLFFFLREKNPGIFFRICVWFTQLGFLVMNIVFYLVSPRTMHRFVGYLEEEAVKTYNSMVREIDHPDGALREWKTKPAPKDMAAYYCLGNEIHKKGSADYERYLEKIPAGLCPPSPSPSPLPSGAAKANAANYLIAVGAANNAVSGSGSNNNDSTTPYYGPTYRDIILCIRADETSHREHNHMFADLHGSATERMIPREELEIVKFASQHAATHSSSAFIRSYQHASSGNKNERPDKLTVHHMDETAKPHPVDVTCVLSPILAVPHQQSNDAHIPPSGESAVGQSLRHTSDSNGNAVTEEHLVPLISAPSVVVGGNNNVSPLIQSPSLFSPPLPPKTVPQTHLQTSSYTSSVVIDHPSMPEQPPKHKPIPIHGPDTAKHHAKAQQHLFTTSASITDPYYIEV